jgi:hypothetical protein
MDFIILFAKTFGVWLAGFFILPVVAICAVIFHANSVQANDSDIEEFCQLLNPFVIRKMYMNNLTKNKGGSSTNFFINMFGFSIYPAFYIAIFVYSFTQSYNFTLYVNYGFWSLFSIMLLIRTWFFGYKIRGITKARLDREAQSMLR